MFAWALARARAGRSVAASRAMMAITTRSSIKVNALVKGQGLSSDFAVFIKDLFDLEFLLLFLVVRFLPLAQGGKRLLGRPFFLLPGGHLFRCCRLPHLGRLIPTTCDNLFAIWRKRHGPNCIVVPFEREQFLAASCLPDL